MDSDRRILSKAAYESHCKELENLEEDGRLQMAARLLAARELGDISENSEFESAKNDQAMLEGRIQFLRALIRDAVLREVLDDVSEVQIGVVVTIRDVDTPEDELAYVIGQPEERVTGVRVLSPGSPLGSALIGKRIGDQVTYEAPGGTFTYEVIDLQPAGE